MIKNFKDITEKELNYMRTHKVYVYEKLDLIKFKVIITSDGMSVFTSRNKPITEIDQIVNSVYKNIMSFVKGINVDYIIDNIGDCEFNFYYKPVVKTRSIEYPHIPNKFIIGSIYTKDKTKNSLDIFKEVFPDVSFLDPIVIKDNIDDVVNKDIMTNITCCETWSGNSIYNIAGLILTSGKITCQIPINDIEPKIEKTTKKLYRDTILENFCNIVMNSDSCKDILESDDTYVNKIYNLFLEYINNTNIFTKLTIDPEDLLPPNQGYIGDIDYDRLPSTVRLVCKGNDVYKNILRILLVTFNRSVFDNKFKNFRNDTRAKLTQILTKINTVAKN